MVYIKTGVPTTVCSQVFIGTPKCVVALYTIKARSFSLGSVNEYFDIHNTIFSKYNNATLLE